MSFRRIAFVAVAAALVAAGSYPGVAVADGDEQSRSLLQPAFAEPAAEVANPPFGSLSLKNLDGERVSIDKLRGQLVLLNFWATWCKPCVGEMPLLRGLATKFHDRGLVVVAASVDDPSDADAVAKFAGHLPEGMQVWVGATAEDMARLKMGSALPTTVLIDRSGRVLGARQGALTEGLLDDDIEQALGGGPDAEPAPKKKHKPLAGATEAAAPSCAAPVL